MNSNKKIPVGVPIIGRNAPAEYDFRLYKVHILKDIKNANGLPFLNPMNENATSKL